MFLVESWSLSLWAPHGSAKALCAPKGLAGQHHLSEFHHLPLKLPLPHTIMSKSTNETSSILSLLLCTTWQARGSQGTAGCIERTGWPECLTVAWQLQVGRLKSKSFTREEQHDHLWRISFVVRWTAVIAVPVEPE